MADASQYSDWDTAYPLNSQASLDRLKLYIKDIEKHIESGNFTVERKSKSREQLTELHKYLCAKRDELVRKIESAAGRVSPWTRGKVLY